MERKTCFAPDFKLLDDGHGWIEGYASTFGNLDRDKDVIEKGAFTASIPAFLRDGFMPVGHNWGGLAVATIDDAHEDEHGLFVRAQFHSTPDAQNARTVVRERLDRGKTVGMSIGFSVAPDGSERKEDGTRIIKQIDLYEVSIVTVPANALALVTSSKSGGNFGLPLNDHSAAVLAAVEELAARLKSHADLRAKDGRMLSAANVDRLHNHASALHQVANDLMDLCAAATPKAATVPRATVEALRILSRLNGVPV